MGVIEPRDIQRQAGWGGEANRPYHKIHTEVQVVGVSRAQVDIAAAIS